MAERPNPFLNCDAVLARIAELRRTLPSAPKRYYRLTIELTKYCSIGCSHCKYNAPLPRRSGKREGMFLTAEQLDHCIQFTEESSIHRLVITGGGEPTHEMTDVCTLIERAQVKEVSLYTAGQWGASVSLCRDHLDQLSTSAINSSAQKKLQIRLSVDDFHFEAIGVHPVATIISSLRESTYGNVLLPPSIRTIVNHDSSVDKLALLLGGEYSRVSEFRGTLATGSGQFLNVDRFNLIPMGRQRKLPDEILDDGLVWKTLEGITQVQGPGWPIWFSGGLNIGIRPSGKVYLYGGSPEVFGRLPEKSLPSILEDLLSDPINSVAATLGLPRYLELIEYCAPEPTRSAFLTHEPSILLPRICASARGMLLSKLVALWVLSESHSSALNVLNSIISNATASSATLNRIKQAYEESNV